MNDYKFKDFVLGFVKFCLIIGLILGAMYLLQDHIPWLYKIVNTLWVFALLAVIFYILYCWIRFYWKK
ncbi:hypothetical protein [Streptococcus merionis]|uniref:Uncharacterized protein n=1 Tax=Streptococcus merionis TaxID=400065 RepID=A0A239SX80_9STRE|nr:hypothetical protein [Streptococcus merionis]SNU90091.1 Uncharacterised protein [Streptococcus merionis]